MDALAFCDRRERGVEDEPAALAALVEADEVGAQARDGVGREDGADLPVGRGGLRRGVELLVETHPPSMPGGSRLPGGQRGRAGRDAGP